MNLTLEHRREDSGDLPVLIWRFESPMRVVSSAPVGGGIGIREWLINAQVPIGYDRLDLAAHIKSISNTLGLRGAGVGLLTGADVTAYQQRVDDRTIAIATVGLGLPTWAAAEHSETAPAVGTINIGAWVPEPMADAALVNLVATVTEAKVQALVDCGIDGSGTATDAVVIVCPCGSNREPFGGPRSRWGAPLARATYEAVRAGTDRWLAR